ncbi:MAG: transglutaminase domain-containing protein, partial [bacterium]|nr:transglutaminase domain-containing protein [bacterium]
LETRSGNAFDTASFLSAVLRASGIHTRYRHGSVRIPAEKVMNWAGGAKTPEAAVQLLAQGGIPVTSQIRGGRIAFVKMEHVWVEAWVDFKPSSGAIHRKGDTWVPMDASFKQYAFTEGMNIQENVPFDAQKFADHIVQTAQISEAEGWVSGIDQNYMQTALEGYQNQITDYISRTSADATVGEVLGTQTIIPSNRTMLAGGLPYKVLARGNTYTELPPVARHK